MIAIKKKRMSVRERNRLRFIPSIKSQWPVRIQTQTIVRAMLKESSSAPVKRPQMPNEILLQPQKKRKKEIHL